MGSHQWCAARLPTERDRHQCPNDHMETYIDDVKQPVTVNTQELPPAPQVEELPSCYRVSYGADLDQVWIRRCVQPCCCWEQGFIVDGEHRPSPDPGH